MARQPREPKELVMPSTIVLVHGAFAESASWDRVIGRLQAAGHHVIAAANPLRGLNSDAAAVSDLVRTIDGPVVLVGHSYGGMVITGVAERVRERIAAIVYLDAFLPEDGQSLASLVGPGVHWPEPLVPPIPAAMFRVNANDAAWVDSKMTPHPVKCFTETLRVSGAYSTISTRVYIRARDFESAPFDAAFNRCRADRAWETIEMKCGHDVMVDDPAELVAVLERLG